MEFEKLLSQWRETSEKIELNCYLSERLISQVIECRLRSTVRRLRNYHLFSILSLLIAIPFCWIMGQYRGIWPAVLYFICGGFFFFALLSAEMAELISSLRPGAKNIIAAEKTMNRYRSVILLSYLLGGPFLVLSFGALAVQYFHLLMATGTMVALLLPLPLAALLMWFEYKYYRSQIGELRSDIGKLKDFEKGE